MVCDGRLGVIQFFLSWIVFVVTIWVQILVFKLLLPSLYNKYKIGDEELRVWLGLVAFLLSSCFFISLSWYFNCW